MPTTSLRGLEVLEILAGMQQPASLRAISQRAALSEPHVFRILQALEDAGYVDHIGRLGYRTGSRAVALSTLIGPRASVLRAIHPVVSRLAAAVHQAVVLHLRSGSYRVLVFGVSAPSGPIRDPAGVLGERSPLAVGASGRVILAYLPKAEIDGFQLDGPTLARLATIRETGYETSFEENHPGINGISGPLLTDDAVALGSMTIAGPAARLPPESLVRLARPLSRACGELAPKLTTLLGPNAGGTVAALDI